MEKKNKTNEILKQGTILAAASILVRLIGMIYRFPLSNLLGEKGNGIYGVAYQFYTVALVVSSYGLPLAVSKMVAAKNVKGQYKNAHKIFVNALVFATITGGTVAAIVYFGADYFVSFMKCSEAAMPLRVLAPTVFCVALLGVFRGYFQGQNTMVPTAISQIFEQIVNAVVSIAAAYTLMKIHSGSPVVAAYGATGSTTGTFSGALAALLFMLGVYFLNRPILKKKMDRDMHEVESNLDIYRVLFLTIVPVVLSQTVYQISGFVDSAMFGNIMAGKNLDEDVRLSLIGVYTGQYTVLLSVPLGVSTAMGTSIIPSIVGSFAKGEMDEVKQKVKTVVKFNMMIAFPCAVGLAVLATPVMKLLFPNLVTYRPVACNMLLYGSIALVFYALSTVTSGVLQAINQMRLPVVHSAISLGIHIVLVYLLLNYTNLGAYALIVGNITFPLGVCILNWHSVAKYLDYQQEIKKTFVIPAIAAVLMGGVAWAVYQGVNMVLSVIGGVVANGIAVILSILVAVVVYFVMLILFKSVDQEELSAMPMGRTLCSVAIRLHLLETKEE